MRVALTAGIATMHLDEKRGRGDDDEDDSRKWVQLAAVEEPAFAQLVAV